MISSMLDTFWQYSPLRIHECFLPSNSTHWMKFVALYSLQCEFLQCQSLKAFRLQAMLVYKLWPLSQVSLYATGCNSMYLGHLLNSNWSKKVNFIHCYVSCWSFPSDLLCTHLHCSGWFLVVGVHHSPLKSEPFDFIFYV